MNKSNNDLNFSKDADITEVLEMGNKMSEMQNQLNSNPTDSQIILNKKINELQLYLKNQYNSKIFQIKQNAIADIYVIYTFIN